MTVDIISVQEAQRLQSLEATIERGIHTFVDVGKALLEIRDSRLYRTTHCTFEDYCRERWGMSRIHAHRMIEAAVVSGNLLPIGNTPVTESQARPLTQLEPEQQREAWQRAVETAPEGKITAAHVQSVVDEYRHPERRGASQPMEVTVFSSRSVEYYTPAPYISAAREVLGAIDLDPASCEMAQETVRAAAFYCEDDDGLAQPWSGRVFCNPPYGTTAGQSNQGIWAQRLIEAYRAGDVPAGILLVKAALGYEWFESLWYEWPVCFPRQRLSFVQPDGSDDGQSKQASAIFYFGPDVDKFRSVFRAFGRVIMPEAE